MHGKEAKKAWPFHPLGHGMRKHERGEQRAAYMLTA